MDKANSNIIKLNNRHAFDMESRVLFSVRTKNKQVTLTPRYRVAVLNGKLNLEKIEKANNSEEATVPINIARKLIKLLR